MGSFLKAPPLSYQFTLQVQDKTLKYICSLALHNTLFSTQHSLAEINAVCVSAVILYIIY